MKKLIADSLTGIVCLKIFFSFLLLVILNNVAYSQKIPKYRAWIGGRGSGVVRKGPFIAQGGVGGEIWIKGNHWESIKVDSFTISVLRDSSLVFYFQNKGNLFGQKVTAAFKTLKTNDRILIFNIWATDYYTNKVYISPLEYWIE